MYAKGKGTVVPSDSQAREKLALYVYEYLLHVGAQKSAQTFLSEIRWEKNITLGEPPGFLHSWWCVFWDLYCAAPDRRETCEHSSEAKAFHDYVSANAASDSVGGARTQGPIVSVMWFTVLGNSSFGTRPLALPVSGAVLASWPIPTEGGGGVEEEEVQMRADTSRSYADAEVTSLNIVELVSGMGGGGADNKVSTDFKGRA
ncbi:single-stranded DNA-binding protein 3-like isoform X2 [Tachysurus ichikawai]